MSINRLFESWRMFEREEEMLQERSIMKEKHPFKAIYVVGPAGAGKSYLGSQIGIPGDFITSNTDARVENVFRAYNIPLKFAASEKDTPPSDLEVLQQNSRTILQNAEAGHTTNLVLKGAPLLFDTTGEQVGKISGRIQRLVDMGYDVAVLQITVPPSVSVARDVERGEEGGRSVGAERVDSINRNYQNAVVKGRGYEKSAAKINQVAGGNYVTILGGDAIPNIYALGSFGKFKEGDLTVSDEEAAEVGNPSFEEVKGMVKQAKKDLAGFLGAGNQNPKGQAMIAGMKALVGAMGSEPLGKGLGKAFGRGQSLRDLFAVRGTKWGQIPAVKNAILAMGGDPVSQVSGAVRGKRGTRYPGEPESISQHSTKSGGTGPRPKISKYQARGSDEYNPEQGGETTPKARRKQK